MVDLSVKNDIQNVLACDVHANRSKNNGVISEKNIEILNEQLNNTKDNNGCFMSIWNDVKVATDKGVSDKKCDEVIESYKKGEINFEEAEQKLKDYAMKQKDSLNLFSNITASVCALGVTALAAGTIAASFGTATPLVLAAIGGLTGALTKAGFKFADRATNKKDNDALDISKLAQDGLSGGIAGSIATVTMGTASSAPTIFSAIVNCGKVGVKTGAVSCGANYTIDSIFDKHKEFNAKDFALTTAEGAIVGGAVGAIMGGANASMHSMGILNSGCSFNTFVSNAGKNTTRDFAANSVCTTEYKILNDGITSSYAA